MSNLPDVDIEQGIITVPTMGITRGVNSQKPGGSFASPERPLENQEVIKNGKQSDEWNCGVSSESECVPDTLPRIESKRNFASPNFKTTPQMYTTDDQKKNCTKQRFKPR